MKWYRQRSKPSIPVCQLPFPLLLLISHVWLFVTPWTAARHASLSFTISQSLLKFMSVELVMPSNHFILCRPLLLPSIFPSIKVLYKESAFLIRWPKYWSFIISPSKEYSGLISFSIDWFDLLALSRVFSSTTVQKHQFSAFFMVQLSDLYMTAGKDSE